MAGEQLLTTEHGWLSLAGGELTPIRVTGSSS